MGTLILASLGISLAYEIVKLIFNDDWQWKCKEKDSVNKKDIHKGKQVESHYGQLE